MGCKPRHSEETLESLRARQTELSRRLAALEADEAEQPATLGRV